MALSTAKQTVKLRDLTITFDEAMEAATPLYPEICTVVPSTGADEKYGWLGASPGVREWLGDRVFNEIRSATYEISNRHWESSELIKKTDIRDDRLGMYGPVLESLANEAAYHPDELVFDLLTAGEAATCFDGQFFFDTDHSWGASGSQSNDITSTVSSTTAVTAAEMKIAIRKAVRTMMLFKKDNGKFYHRPTLTRLDGLALFVPPALRDQTFDALESQLLGGGDTNVVIDKPTVYVSPYLASDVKFYLMRTNTPVKPFIFQAREPLSRQIKGLDDIETKDAKFMTEARYNVGYGMWANAVLTTLTSGG